jgi:hypothetical protein
MRFPRLVVAAAVTGLILGIASLGAAAEARKKVKGNLKPATGAAGAVAGKSTKGVLPSAIDDNDFQGVFCALDTPNVHWLGTVPPGWQVTIDFDSDDTSDPIAILTTLKINGTDIGAEVGGSDDDGGNLNPRFDLRRPYQATYVLTVGTADATEEACYAFRVRIRP